MRLSAVVQCLLTVLPLACSAGSKDVFVPPPGSDAGPWGDSATEVGLLFDVHTPLIEASTGECHEAIDIVFVLDVSSSMGFVLDKLGSEISSVATKASELTAAVKAEGPHFGLVPFVDNHVLDLGGAAEGGKVHLSAESLSKAFAFHKATFTTPNRNPGDGVSGPTMQNPICEENAVDALYAAAKDFPWRPNSARIIIVATDDTFLERPDNYGDRDGDKKTDKTDFPREGDYPAAWTVKETVEALKASGIRVFSFSARGDALHPCGTGRRLPREARAAGWSAPYWNEPPIPLSTDGADYDLALVQSGAVKLSDTINDIVVDSHCNPPVY